MAILIQSLSWTLLYSLVQGLVVYLSLMLVLKVLPATPSAVRYRLSLSAMIILLGWFITTWWQQFHAMATTSDLLITFRQHGAIGNYAYTANVPDDRGKLYSSILSMIQFMAPWLSAFYFTGLAVILLRLSAGVLHLSSLRRKGLSQPEIAVYELLTTLKDRMRLSRGVQLFVSAKAQVPMVAGILRPVILMPAAVMTQLSMEQVETILLHELAHIKRYDHLLNILHTLIETILFFNPFLWMISSVTRREMEHCCDDIVLNHSKEPIFYASALAVLAQTPVTVSAFTVAASGQSNYLFNRIKRIMEMKKNPFSYSRMAAAIIMITVITCSVIWLAPSSARGSKGKPKTTIVKTPSVEKVELQVAADEEQKVPVKKAQQEQANINKPASVNETDAVTVTETDESKLINQMLGDGVIDQVKGFVVEKMQDKLYVNGQLQSEEVTRKYLQPLKQEYIRVEVFPFMERLNRHPDAGFMQILLPVMFSSGCVDYTPKKPGC